jgi:hypothetical protein
LEFDSVEEATEIKDALEGYKWKLAIWDLDQELRNTTKYGRSILESNDEATTAEVDVADRIRDRIREILTDYNLQME